MPHLYHHHHHFHILSILRRKELSEIYIMTLIRSFALSLIGIFVPAYLLDLGYSLDALVFYYISIGVFYGLLNIITVKLSSKIGVKHSIMFSMPFIICYLLLLNSLPTYGWSLYFIAFVGAIYSSLYWPAFHITFLHSSDRDHRGEEYGLYESFVYLPMIFAPLLGGLIISFFGFHLLFYMVCFLLLIAPLPLFFSQDIYEPFTFSLKKMVSQRNVRNIFVFFFEGFSHYAELVLWPILIFIVLKDFLSLGILATLSICGAAVMTYILGRMSDVVSKRKILRASSVFISILWVFRSFAHKFSHFAILNPLAGISFTLFSVPYMALFYNKGARHPAEFVIFREFALHSLGGPILLLIFYFTKSFLSSFIIAGISTYAFWFF